MLYLPKNKGIKPLTSRGEQSALEFRGIQFRSGLMVR